MTPVAALKVPSGAWVGFACAFASAVAFSWKAIFAKLAYRTGIDATTVLGLRMAIALPAYVWLSWVGARNQPRPLTRVDLGAVAGLGLLGYYLASYLDFTGLMYISAGLERLILFLYPSIVVLLAAWLKHRPVARAEWQSMLLGYLGIACVFAGDADRGPHGGAAWLGVLAVFASSIVYSAYLVLAERYTRQLGSVRFTGLAMSSACLCGVLTLGASAGARELLAIPLEAVYICAAMAIISTVIPTLLLTEAVRRIGPGRAALCGMIGPITTIGLEVGLLGESAGWSDALGTALVIASVVLLTRSERVPAPPTAEPMSAGEPVQLATPAASAANGSDVRAVSRGSGHN